MLRVMLARGRHLALRPWPRRVTCSGLAGYPPMRTRDPEAGDTVGEPNVLRRMRTLFSRGN
eukprot:scaffold9484_cov124-Isochrysis_galbana.AAC.7